MAAQERLGFIKYYKFVLTAICLCVFLTACNVPHQKEQVSSSSVPDNVSEHLDESFYPSLIDYESSKDRLKDLTFGSIGWTLRHRKDYLFAVYGKYILRYNIRDNKIDKMVELGKSYNNWPFGTSFSSDGDYCIAYSFDFSGEDSRNYFLIDFIADKTWLICGRVNEFDLNKVPESVRDEISGNSFSRPKEQTNYSITRKQTDENKAEYYFRNEHGEIKIINSLSPLGHGGAYTIVDKNRIGAIMPQNPEEEWALGYYKFVVIDVSQDKIVQDYMIN